MAFLFWYNIRRNPLQGKMDRYGSNHFPGTHHRLCMTPNYTSRTQTQEAPRFRNKDCGPQNWTSVILWIVIFSLMAGIILLGFFLHRAELSKSTALQDYCDEGPCENGGTCFNSIETHHCDCDKNWKGDKCTEVYCLEGFAFTGTGCEKCPVGRYKPTEGNTNCTSCPEGSTTVTTGAIKEHHCSLCRERYQPTKDACTKCPTGKYKNETGNQGCDDCPAGTFVNVTGQSSCHTCEAGTYSPDSGMTNCQTCPGNVTGDRKDCVECGSNLCQNSGSCVDGVNFYTCTCSTGFTGTNCEINIDDCSKPNPCLNNGTCVDGLDSYNCTCATSFTGTNCEINIDDCPEPNPCLNHGTCVDGLDSYNCTCANGFTGKNCEININDCPEPNPCLNIGTCVDGLDSYNCTCATGFTGTNCEINIDDCPEPNPCLNNGTCVDGINSFTCDCLPLNRNKANCENECLDRHDIWCEPKGWTAGQPNLYFPFESTDNFTAKIGSDNSSVDGTPLDTQTSVLVSGVIGLGIHTDNSEYIDMGYINDSTCFSQLQTCKNGMSLAFWIKYPRCPSSGTFISTRSEDTDDQSPGIYCSSELGKLWVDMYSPTIEFGMFTRPNQNISTWFHMTVVLEGNRVRDRGKVYINGEIDCSVHSYKSIEVDKGPNTLILGRNLVDSNDGNVDVTLDELVFFDKVLSADQVKAVYNTFEVVPTHSN